LFHLLEPDIVSGDLFFAEKELLVLNRMRFLVVLGTLLVTTMACAEDWLQFRGPNASGVSTESKNLPVDFSFEKNVLWKQVLGEGIACPIVAQGRVIATTMADKQTFSIRCFNAASGDPYWRKDFKVSGLPAITSPNTPASSTPASDGKRVYVFFDTLGLMAFDLADGKLLWKQDIPEPFYLLDWGAAASPIVYKDMVIFNQDDDLNPFVVAYDAITGKERWRTERTEMLAGYALPVICRANGRDDLVLAGSGKLKGYDPSTGKERWNCNSLLRTIMTTPVVKDDRIYITVQSYGDTDRVLKFALLQWKDTNQDGKLDKKEIGKAFWKKFDRGDANGDGFLVDDEIDNAFQAATNRVGGGNIIQAVRGGGTGDVTKTHVVFNLDHPASSNISSPLAYGNQLFMVKKGGITACFDNRDGKTIWMKKRINNFGNYYASPVAGDGKIYVMGENGFLSVLEHGPTLKRLSKNDMGDSCVATPAIADGRIFVRTLNTLYCFSREAEE